MRNALNEFWLDVAAHPGHIAFTIYFLVGFAFACFVASRAGARFTGKRSWDRRQRAFNMLDNLFVPSGALALVFVLQILLWPLWLILFWLYQLGDDNTDT